MTEYVILQRYTDEVGEIWRGVGLVRARSTRSAIRECIQKSELGDGIYVATPVRSWQTVSVNTETKTALKFS